MYLQSPWIFCLLLICSINYALSMYPNFLIKSIVNSFRESLTNLPVFFRNLGETLSAAIDEECVFRCPNGAIHKPNLHYKPKGNGCGVPGLQIPKYIPVSQLEDCCNDHDICYGVCGKRKETCDEKFKKCLYEICKIYKKYIGEDLIKGCKAVAKAMFTAVTALGCTYYLHAQEEACICSSDEL